MRQQLIACGFEILEYEEVSRNWSIAAWSNSNDITIPLLENEESNLDPVEKQFFEFLALYMPMFYNDIRHMTVEEIWERFPKLSQKLDPATMVYGVTHKDVK
jgi:hypothetical protein